VVLRSACWAAALPAAIGLAAPATLNEEKNMKTSLLSSCVMTGRKRFARLVVIASVSSIVITAAIAGVVTIVAAGGLTPLNGGLVGGD
jgi:hypothetical protein